MPVEAPDGGRDEPPVPATDQEGSRPRVGRWHGRRSLRAAHRPGQGERNHGKSTRRAADLVLAILRKKSLEPKPASAGAWWLSDAARLAKANEVGVGPAHYGESTAHWDARIRAAIDNGGKPPAPQVFVRDTLPTGDLSPLQDQVQTPKPRGFLKDMLRQAQAQSEAQKSAA